MRAVYAHAPTLPRSSGDLIRAIAPRDLHITAHAERKSARNHVRILTYVPARAYHPHMTPTSGLDLQIERLRLRPRVTQERLGSLMKPPVSASRVASIEGDFAPNPRTIARYRDALARAVPARPAQEVA
jgi:hypothetical protein